MLSGDGGANSGSVVRVRCSWEMGKFYRAVTNKKGCVIKIKSDTCEDCNGGRSDRKI